MALFLWGGFNFIFSQKSVVKKETIASYSIDVYVPNNYNSNKYYPVVYFNDGQMLFSPFSFFNLQKILDDLIMKKTIKDLIVVGIHAKGDRSSMYVPFHDNYLVQADNNFKSQAESYAKDLVEKIIPYIDNKYNTIKTSKGRAIFGFSHGGLNATWLTLNYPQYFSMSAAISPSYWVADYGIFKEAQKYQKETTIWFDIGTQEWNYYVPFIEKIKNEGGHYGQNIFYYEVPNAKHDLEFWFDRISNPLIVFNGVTKGELKDWHIETEVIKSQSREGVYYLRLNPIVKLSNGLTYSLATEAVYNLINKQDGHIYRDGRFEFTNTNDLEIEVSYQNLKKTVVLKYKKIAKMMKND